MKIVFSALLAGVAAWGFASASAFAGEQSTGYPGHNSIIADIAKLEDAQKAAADAN